MKLHLKIIYLCTKLLIFFLRFFENKYINIISDNKIKEYEAIAKLGVYTDSFDITGKVLNEEEVREISDLEIIETLESFIGEQDQTPPIYSAKKVNGKRLYKYAHEEKTVEIKKQQIIIHGIKMLDRISNEEVKFSTSTSKGTYIRSLIVDVAEKLGTIGTMSYLKRTKTDGFDVENAKKIEDIEISDIILLEDIVLSKYSQVIVYDKITKLVKNGAMLTKREEIKYPCVYIDSETNKPIAIYDADDKMSKPIFMF